MTGYMEVAALFVDPKGVYSGLPGVDCWGEERDARRYAGPHPVVAHPPCSRWCQLASVVEARYGHKVGDDDGCFESALASVRAFGGVLEHPAYTKAWPEFGLPKPNVYGWTATMCGGWVAHVEQGMYGHLARKATWLYAFGLDADELPSLRWGKSEGRALVSWMKNHVPETETRPRIGKKAASATPPVTCS